jgi:uncharacterized membrane protein
MLELLRQRLTSKTYWVAIIGSLLTIMELNSGFIGQFIPAEYRSWVIMLWPVIMLTLREVTTTALSAK